MTLPPELRALVLVVFPTALMWIPYTLALMQAGGLRAAVGNRERQVPLAAWAERARRARANAEENPALFAPLVLLAAMRLFGSQAIAMAADIHLAARFVHYVVYVTGIPLVRTLAFVVGWGGTITIALLLLS